MFKLNTYLFSGADRNSGRSLDQSVWYGPSYQPKGWNPDDMLSLRAKEFSYDDREFSVIYFTRWTSDV